MIPERLIVPPHVQDILPKEPSSGNKIKFVNPNVKNYPINIAHAGQLHKDGMPVMKANMEKGTAIIVGSGPSLANPDVLEEVRRLTQEEGADIIATKAAIKYVHDQGILVKYAVTMDPGSHIACEEKVPRVPGVIHIVASSSDPTLFEYLKDEEVMIFHSATGYEKEVEMYQDLFEVADVMTGGYNVVNRAVSCAMYMGYKKIVLAGCDCGWRENESFYVDGKQNRPGVDMNDGGKVEMTDDEGAMLSPPPEGARHWMTRPDMLASGIALARMAKKFGPDRFLILGDTLPQHLQHKSESFLKQCGDF